MSIPILGFHGLIARLARRLRPLARNDRGNILILTAAMMVPLIALVGSAIDIGRYQTVKTRLQTACDAGVLAGRRAMTAGTVDDSVKTETLRFFNFNFPQQSFQTAAFTPTVTAAIGSNQTVVLTATTTMPMTLMKFFGYSTMSMSVTCNAKQDFVNTDIILVLDTTGSMDDVIPGDTETKIVSLRKAVLAFYDQLKPVQDQLAAGGLRLRYGIVPYASAVNVGKLIRGIDPTYMLSTKWTYQSRTPPTGICVGTPCFTYEPKQVDIGSYVAGNTVNVTPLIGNSDPVAGTYLPTKTANQTVWKGCIEERQTTRMSATASSIDDGALDLDINRKPDSDASRWKPYWPELSFTVDGTIGGLEKYSAQRACPSEAARLKTWDRASLNTYLNALDPDGGTYHDNGMMWGARLGSPDGIFGVDNPTTYANIPVKRYIIFMTDGAFSTGYKALYSSYGIEKLDKRVTPGGSSSDQTDQLARHVNRFNLLCSRAKSMGYNIWVLVFDETLNSSLTNCASTAAQASVSDNSSELNAKFIEIGKNIGSLRLSK